MSDKDEAVAICSECKTQMPDSQAFKNGFLQEGKSAACKACGGVVVVVMQSQVKQVMDNIDRSRGIK
jgi:DNA-directed RNA polymerase subunit RPC12/RpoP